MQGNTFLAVLVIVLGVVLIYVGLTGRTNQFFEALKS